MRPLKFGRLLANDTGANRPPMTCRNCSADVTCTVSISPHQKQSTVERGPVHADRSPTGVNAVAAVGSAKCQLRHSELVRTATVFNIITRDHAVVSPASGWREIQTCMQ